MIKLVKLVSVMVGCVVLLSACATATTFGVPNDQWATLSPAQQKVAMKSYYKQQEAERKRQAKLDAEKAKHDAEVAKIKEQNAPINNIIDAFSSIAAEQSHHNSAKHKQCMTDAFGKTVCGFNCYKDDFGRPHCAQAADQQCITGDFNKTECGYNCYKDDFGRPHCAKA